MCSGFLILLCDLCLLEVLILCCFRLWFFPDLSFLFIVQKEKCSRLSVSYVCLKRVESMLWTSSQASIGSFSWYCKGAIFVLDVWAMSAWSWNVLMVCCVCAISGCNWLSFSWYCQRRNIQGLNTWHVSSVCLKNVDIVLWMCRFRLRLALCLSILQGNEVTQANHRKSMEYRLVYDYRIHKNAWNQQPRSILGILSALISKLSSRSIVSNQIS